MNWDELHRLAAGGEIAGLLSHHLDELPGAVDQVVLLKAGRIVTQGKPQAILTSAHLSRLFDCEVNVLRTDGRFVASTSTPGE